jgi:vitamin K-dependent gamma-carboxylase
MGEKITTTAPLKSSILKARAYLEEPVSAASLAVFRMCFATSVIALIVEYFRQGWVEVLASKFHFSFIPGVVPLPGVGLHVHLIMVAVFAFLIGIGLYYRFACVLLFFSFSWIFLCEKSLYQNHIYLICLFSLLFSFVDAHNAYSIDSVRLKLLPVVPRWNIEIFKFQLVLVYFYSGLAKLNDDWLHGYPQTKWIIDRAAKPIVAPFLAPYFADLFRASWFVPLVTFGGIVFDLTIGFLLWWQPTFWLAVILSCVFHLLNYTLFTIDVFPFLMLSTIGLFAREDWPARLLGRWRKAEQSKSLEGITLPRTRPAVFVFICLYISFQLLFPLRRFLYAGDTSWTERGQRFAWRMMLRDKQCKSFVMIFAHPQAAMHGVIHPELSLTTRQLEELYVIPDMILQFAHSAAESLEKEMGYKPIVRARSIVSLNGRPAQNLIYMDADLAGTQASVLPGTATWIVPLRQFPQTPTHSSLPTKQQSTTMPTKIEPAQSP